MKETTFVMIKPEAVAAGLSGAILHHLEKESFEIQALKMIMMDKSVCESFYEEHKDKGFYIQLVEYIISGPVLVMALLREDAINCCRELIGHTDPKQAKPNTIRALYGKSIDQNAIHASDSLKSAKRELGFFFKDI